MIYDISKLASKYYHTLLFVDYERVCPNLIHRRLKTSIKSQAAKNVTSMATKVQSASKCVYAAHNKVIKRVDDKF